MQSIQRIVESLRNYQWTSLGALVSLLFLTVAKGLTNKKILNYLLWGGRLARPYPGAGCPPHKIGFKTKLTDY